MLSPVDDRALTGKEGGDGEWHVLCMQQQTMLWFMVGTLNPQATKARWGGINSTKLLNIHKISDAGCCCRIEVVISVIVTQVLPTDVVLTGEGVWMQARGLARGYVKLRGEIETTQIESKMRREECVWCCQQCLPVGSHFLHRPGAGLQPFRPSRNSPHNLPFIGGQSDGLGRGRGCGALCRLCVSVCCHSDDCPNVCGRLCVFAASPWQRLPTPWAAGYGERLSSTD